MSKWWMFQHAMFDYQWVVYTPLWDDATPKGLVNGMGGMMVNEGTPRGYNWTVLLTGPPS